MQTTKINKKAGFGRIKKTLNRWFTRSPTILCAKRKNKISNLFYFADGKLDAEVREKSGKIVFTEIKDEVEDGLMLVVLRCFRSADFDLEK